jgi:ABC-2 type transport system permease protein
VSGGGAMTEAETGVRAISATLTTARPEPAGPLRAALAFGWRGMLKIKHVPEQLLDVTVTPVLFTVMFTYMYGGAISGSTGAYLQFLLPGILMMSVLFTTVYSGVALNTDKTKGVVDRFQTLPVWRPAPLLGAVLGDSVRYLAAGSVVMLVGFILGYEAEGGVPGVLGALLLVTLFSCGLAWVFTTVGLLARTPNAVLNGGFMALFPITFVSNAFVPPETLPAGLEAVVDANPVSLVTTAARGLLNGDPVAGDIALALGIAAVLTAIFAPITARLYSRG